MIAVSIAVGWKILYFAGGSGVGSAPGPTSLFSATDTITIWLGVLAVMIATATLVVTAVGVWVGVLAFFGYAFFRQELPKIADTASRAAADDYLKGKVFEGKMEDKIKQNLSWTAGTVGGQEVTIQSSESPQPIDEQIAVADKYPKS